MYISDTGVAKILVVKMNVKEKLRQIGVLESELNVYFDGLIYEVIRDMTDQYWTVFDEYPEENEEGNTQPFTRASDVGWSDHNPV